MDRNIKAFYGVTSCEVDARKGGKIIQIWTMKTIMFAVMVDVLRASKYGIVEVARL